MKRYAARQLLNYSTDQLWEMLTGEFSLLFEDGETVETNARETLFSSYAWDFFRHFPLAPILSKHHVSHVLGGQRLGSDTHLELLGIVGWSIYDHYLTVPGYPEHPVDLRDRISELIYRYTNNLYNALTYRCEEYVVSLDVTDIMSVLAHQRVREANESIQPTQKSIDDTYQTVTQVLRSATEMATNPVSLAVRSRLVNIKQVLQCVSARGFLTDTDSNIFRYPVLRGYAAGIRLFYDSLIESRSAAKSLIFSKTPLQQAEYFARRLQLMSQIVRNLHIGDCGTTEYVRWHVRGPHQGVAGGVSRSGDLKQLNGTYYLADDGELRPIKPTDRHLIGKEILIRSPIHCAHEDPYGICTTCFGELSLSVPRDTNIGHMCCTSMTQKSSQNVLSVKHLDGSSVVEGIVLVPEDRRFLKVGSDENTYLLSDALRGKQVTLRIPADKAPNITDVLQIRSIDDLNITRISELETLDMIVSNGVREEIVSIVVHIGRRLASMTHPLLAHVRQRGWGVDEQGNYTIDMTGYDWELPILTLPLKHVNMSDHSKDIASLLESNMDELHLRDKIVSPASMLLELYDLVNDRLDVNLAVLGVILYGSMIVSAERNDYSLPKPGTDSGLGVMSKSMALRSLSAAMAYEGHRETLVAPLSYTIRNRPDHPLDILVCPAEVIAYGTE